VNDRERRTGSSVTAATRFRPGGRGRVLWYARRAVPRIVLLSDRSLPEVLPPPSTLGHDVKTERLEAASGSHLRALAPAAVLIDAAVDPDAGLAVARAVRRHGVPAPLAVIVLEADLERLPWIDAADDVVVVGAAPAEIRLRLDLLARRGTGSPEGTLRLGELSIDTESYRVVAGGRQLDLTFKEFELLRFLVQRPGRVFTRSSLLREVWGYDYYGGTRTVDVHVRRLRAKLGPENETLIQTVRGVGYLAVDPDT